MADLGGYSFALGSAQLLTPEDGNIYASLDSGINAGGHYTGERGKPRGPDCLPDADEPRYLPGLSHAEPLHDHRVRIHTPAGIRAALPPDQPFDFSSGFVQNR